MATLPGFLPYIHSDVGDKPLPYPRPLEDNMQPTLNLEALAAPFREIYTPAQARAATARLILRYGEDGGTDTDPDRDSRRLLIAILSHIGEARA